MRLRITAVVLVCCAFTALTPTIAPAAPGTLRAQVKTRVATPPAVLYGTSGARKLGASGAYVAGGTRARAVLERKRGRRAVTVKRARIKRGRFSISWRVPGRAKSVTVRVRIMRGGRTLARGSWRSVRLTPKPAAPVRVPAPSRVVAAPPADGPGTLVLSGRTNITTGSTIAVGPGPQTPAGLIARATSVTRRGGQTIVQTVPATIVDAVPVGELEMLAPSKQLPEIASAAATPLRRRLADNFECSGGASAQAVVSVDANAGTKMDASWSPFKGVRTSFTASVSASARAEASISASGKCTLKETPLLASPLRFGTYAFSVAGIPITLTPEMNVKASGGIEANAAITTSARAGFSGTAGVKYENGFKPIGSFTTNADYTPPTLSANGHASIAVAPELFIRINGLAGPVVDVRTGLDLNADISKNPWWTLTAPVDVGAKLRLNVWKINKESERFSVYSTTLKIADAGGPLAPASPPPPVPQPAPQPSYPTPTLPAPDGSRLRAHMTWDTATDVDLYVWDDQGNMVYFGEQEAIPGAALLEDVIPGYGPEEFVEYSDYGRHYTYGVCMYNTRDEYDTTSVRLTITDPDGTQRGQDVQLDYDGEGIIVGDSPQGGGYTPDDGWCRSV